MACPKIFLPLTASILFLTSVAASADQAAFQQQRNSPAIVSMEAEHFHHQHASGRHYWSPLPGSKLSGANGLQALPQRQFLYKHRRMARSPRLDYKVNFIASGRHYLWVRGTGRTTRHNSIYTGFDNRSATANSRVDFATPYRPAWSRQASIIEVTSPGDHTINIWVREMGVIIDKVVVSNDPDFIPAAAGPEESPRVKPAEPNRAPVFDSLPEDLTTIEQQVLQFTVSAFDPDGPQPLLSASSLPPGATFDNRTGRFHWLPQIDTAGTYLVSFHASDSVSGLKTTAMITLTVTPIANPVSTDITLSWDRHPDPILGYVLYYGTTPESTPEIVDELQLQSGLFDPEQPAVRYNLAEQFDHDLTKPACFRISAYDGTQESGLSNATCITFE